MQVYFPHTFSKGQMERGVAALVKINIPALLTLQVDNHEGITLKLSCKERFIVLIADYRAPDSTHEFWHRL